MVEGGRSEYQGFPPKGFSEKNKKLDEGLEG